MELFWWFFSACAVLVLAAAGAIVLTALHKRGRVLTPFHLVFAGVVVFAFLLLAPLYARSLSDQTFPVFRTIAFSLHHTFQLFTLDADKTFIVESLKDCRQTIAPAYGAALSALYVAAPVFTFGFVLSFFQSVAASFRIFFHFYGNVYVFSQLNESSLQLGGDLRKSHKHALIIYTDVRKDGDERLAELAEKASKIRAICVKTEMPQLSLGLHAKTAGFYFFAIAEKESENVRISLRMIEKYREKNGVSLYVFSAGTEGEMLLNCTDQGKVFVRRVNKIRSNVHDYLYEDGTELFESALPETDGQKRISILIAGLGQYGTELLKALVWYCQMDGYRLHVDAYDADPSALDRFTAQAPELMEMSGKGKEYDVTIHPGADLFTGTFEQTLRRAQGYSCAFVCLGQDEENVRAAVQLRTLFARYGQSPVIRAVVQDSEKAKALSGAVNFRGQPYDVRFLGQQQTVFSEAVILNTALEEEARQRHMKYGKEEDFWRYEYNYNSSVATAIHMRARIACGIPGADKEEKELTKEERVAIERLEHRRWNAYMRANGYVFSGSTEKSSRNDLAKTHNDLVEYDELQEEEKRKDSRVGTK